MGKLETSGLNPNCFNQIWANSKHLHK